MAVTPEIKERLAAFVRELAEELGEIGDAMSIALLRKVAYAAGNDALGTG